MINKQTLKRKLECFPKLYLWLLNLKRIGHWSQNWIVSSDTDITIEGFPRSGNSFARSAFKAAQSQKYSIATHVHSYAQVLRSVELGKPTMVLLREPRAACLSLVALTFEIESAELSEDILQRAKIELLNNLAIYAEFYRRVISVKDDVIIAEFHRVTRNYGQVIQRMNTRYNTDFNIYLNSETNDQEVFNKGGFHLSPSKNRNTIKDYLNDCLKIPEVEALANQADDIYTQVLKIEEEQTKRYDSSPLN